METKMKFLSAVMKLYLIIWIITPVLGMYEATVRFRSTVTSTSSSVTPSPLLECNNSLGLPELDIDRIYIRGGYPYVKKNKGDIRLSENRKVFESWYIDSSPVIVIDLGEVYHITGMIIKGKEGYGTIDLDSFYIRYSNSSFLDPAKNFRSMTLYTNEIGEIQTFEGTTKEENIRYLQFDPSFLARYFGFSTKVSGDGAIAMQFDVLGCNITQPSTTETPSSTVTPCNDTLETKLVPITLDFFEKCENRNKLEVKVVGNLPYQITMVNITVTDPEYFNKVRKEFVIYGIRSNNDEYTLDIEENQTIYKFEPSVQSMSLCIFVGKTRNQALKKDIYNYITLEAKGCLNGALPAGSSIE